MALFHRGNLWNPLVTVAAMAAPLRLVTRRSGIRGLMPAWSMGSLYQTRLFAIVRAAVTTPASTAVTLPHVAVLGGLSTALVPAAVAA